MGTLSCSQARPDDVRRARPYGGLCRAAMGRRSQGLEMANRATLHRRDHHRAFRRPPFPSPARVAHGRGGVARRGAEPTWSEVPCARWVGRQRGTTAPSLPRCSQRDGVHRRPGDAARPGRRARPAVSRGRWLVTRGGHFGRYLRIDVTRGQAEPVPLDDASLRAVVGGVGLGALLLLQETPPGVDPLGPEAAVIFSFGPLGGTSLTTSAKLAVVAKSPLTGRITDALTSSHFALSRQRTGLAR